MYVTMATSNLSLINDSTNCQIYENHDSKFSMRSFILNKIARDSTFMVYVTTTRIEVYSKNKSSMYIVNMYVHSHTKVTVRKACSPSS